MKKEAVQKPCTVQNNADIRWGFTLTEFNGLSKLFTALAFVSFSSGAQGASQCNEYFASSVIMTKERLSGPVFSISTVGTSGFSTQPISFTGRKIENLVDSENGFNVPEYYFSNNFLEGKLAIDAGSGRGWLVRELNDRGLKAVGLDLDPGGAKGLKPGEFVWGDMLKTPFTAKSVDVVFSFASLPSYSSFSLELTRMILSEFERVVKPGGFIILAPVDALVISQAIVTLDGLKLNKHSAVGSTLMQDLREDWGRNVVVIQRQQ